MAEFEYRGEIWHYPDDGPHDEVVDWVPPGNVKAPASPLTAESQAMRQRRLRRFRAIVGPALQQVVDRARQRGESPGEGDMEASINDALDEAYRRDPGLRPEGPRQRWSLRQIRAILAEPLVDLPDDWQGVQMETVEGTVPAPAPEPEPDGEPMPADMVTEIGVADVNEAFSGYARSDPVAELLRRGR